MKYIIIAVLAVFFCLILCSFPSSAVISSSAYSNGGSIILNSEECYETSNDLMRFGTSNDSYLYNGKSQTIVSLGRTGVQKTDTTRVETLGMLNAFDTVGMFATQTNSPETPCDENNFLINGTDSSRYPETQTAEGMWGLMGSGPGTTYESEIVTNGKTVGASVQGTTPQGYLYEDAYGALYAGLNKSETILQYSYYRHDHGLLSSDENKSLDAGYDWLWDTSAEEIVNDTPANETGNETVEGANS